MARFFKHQLTVKSICSALEIDCSSDAIIDSICSPERTTDNSICVYMKGELPNICENLWLLTNKAVEGYNCILIDNPKAALSKLNETLFEFDEIEHSIAEDVVLGENVVIENHVQIGSGTVIEHGAIIYKGTIIGKNCLIQANSSVGSLPYTFYNDDKGNLQRLPSFGHVEVGDNVEIGANSTIDVGSVDNTIIHTNTKIDNLVHIGHDCEVGENATIVAGSMLCGYVSIGRNTRLAPNCTVKQRLSIGENCVVGLGSVVMTNIPDNMSCFGVPARKAKKG